MVIFFSEGCQLTKCADAEEIEAQAVLVCLCRLLAIDWGPMILETDCIRVAEALNAKTVSNARCWATYEVL